MRIGIVLPLAPSYSETFFVNKIKGLEKHGFSVVIFTNDSNRIKSDSYNIKFGPKLTANKVYVSLISIKVLFLSFLFYFRKSKRLYVLDKKDGISFLQRLKNIISSNYILKERLDWLHFGFGTMVLNKENVAKAMGANMAVSFRGFDIGVYPLKNLNCYSKLWKKVNRIHVISDDIKALVYKNGFENECEIVKITPAIEASFFNKEIEAQSSRDINFVTTARLHWKKGLEYTLEALSILRDSGVTFHYTIIGIGEDLERLKFAVYQLNLEEDVTFLGKIEHDKIIHELQKANIYLQYSIQEGFCNAVLEAQASGLLCIVSDAEGLSENVLHDETGWVVPKCDAYALADRIKDVLHLSDKSRDRIIKKARDRVLKNFMIDRQHQKFVEFYNNSEM